MKFEVVTPREKRSLRDFPSLTRRVTIGVKAADLEPKQMASGTRPPFAVLVAATGGGVQLQTVSPEVVKCEECEVGIDVLLKLKLDVDDEPRAKLREPTSGVGSS